MIDPPYRVKNMMPGMIMGWPFSVASIPSGWHLCDGTMGTPDYRNLFLVGAGDIHDPGDAGGADSQNHTFTGDQHLHDIPPGKAIAAGTDFSAICSLAPAIGTTNNADNRPAFKAMCWIMKL